jgi:hypothetical protein
MYMSIPWGPIISGAAAIGGALINKSSSDSAQALTKNQWRKQFAQNKKDLDRAYKFQDLWNRTQLKYSETEAFRNRTKSIQQKVADAKKAGLHPLYALGASASHSPGFIAGQSPTGSSLSPGINQADHSIGNAVAEIGKIPLQAEAQKRSEELHNAQVQSLNASANRDEAAAIESLSRAKRTEQEANITQDTNVNQQKELPPLYIQAQDPITGEVIWLPNNELGIEMPETIGAGYWGKSKIYDARGKKRNVKRGPTRKSRRRKPRSLWR